MDGGKEALREGLKQEGRNRMKERQAYLTPHVHTNYPHEMTGPSGGRRRSRRFSTGKGTERGRKVGGTRSRSGRKGWDVGLSIMLSVESRAE